MLLLAIGCVIGAAWYFMPGGFLPEEDQGYVMVVVNAPEASSLRVTQEALVGADRIIRSLYRDPDYIDDPIVGEYVDGIWRRLLAGARARGETIEGVIARLLGDRMQAAA